MATTRKAWRAALAGWAVLAAGAVPAASAEWVRIGPDGGGITGFAASASRPDVVYVGTVRLVFRSTDHGKSWHFASPEGGSLYDLAVDPRTPSTVYAAAERGLFKSLDGGSTWAKVFPFESAEPQLVRLVAVDPKRPRRVWAAPFDGPLWRSLDGGRRWHTDDDWPAGLTTLTVDPVHPSTLYATLEQGGVLKSTDSGTTWTRIEQGLPAEVWANVLAVHPRDRRTLLLSSSAGPFKSTDAGASWRQVPGWKGAARDLAFDPSHPSDVYATTVDGLLKSSDGGATWNPAGLETVTVAPLLATSRGLLVGTEQGVFASTDRAQSWHPSNGGLTAQGLLGLAADSQDPPRLYAGSFTGVFKSADRGRGWRKLDVPNTPGFSYRGPLAVDPHDPQTVYASFFRGLGTSSNGGRRWSLTELACVVPWGLTLDPASPGTLYVVGDAGFGASCSQAGPCTAYRIDATEIRCVLREPFNFLGPVPVFPVFAVDPHAPSRLVAVLVDGLHQSTDSGGTWSPLAALRPAALAFVADRPGLVYGGFAGAVGHSLDGGATWRLADLPVSGTVHSLALDPRDSSTLYAATLTDGVFKSTDSGRTWKPTAKLPAGTMIEEILVDPADPDLVYAATYFTSVLMLRQ